jgi:DNA mismatch endonuclease, patch repair protein
MRGALSEALPGTLSKAPRLSYKGFRPASPEASRAARGSSNKKNTRCEVALRRALWAAGCRYRKDVAGLPGRPDIVFVKARIAMFCDGDFWHGRDWEVRRQKLSRGTNSRYWTAKIQRNIERDWQITSDLQEMGWTVLRVWESQIEADPGAVAQIVVATLRGRALYAPALDSGTRMA